jgi:sugar/nucleoside kinase (ribokinase family)
VVTVAVIGNLVKDIVAGSEPRPGGVVYYSARALAALGATDDVQLVTRCSEKDAETLLPALESFGLPTAWRAASETQTFSFHYEGDHRVMDVVGLGDQWSEEDIRGWAGDAIRDARWIVLGALTREDFTREAILALVEGGRRLLVDGQALVRLRRLGPLVEDRDVDPTLYPLIAGLKLNDEEAAILVGSLEPQALRSLGVPEIVVTKGSQGALVVTADVAELVPAAAVDGPVDPTGAGDTFWVAYLLARREGEVPVSAASRASAFVSQMISRA